jgi:hypothetical protein
MGFGKIVRNDQALIFQRTGRGLEAPLGDIDVLKRRRGRCVRKTFPHGR